MAATLPSDPAPASLSVAVVDPDPKVRTRVAMQLGETSAAVAFSSLAALEEKLDAGRPLVLVAGPSLATPLAMPEITRFLQARPEVRALVVVDQLSIEVVRAAMRGGISDVVALPSESDQLREAVARLTRHLPPAAPLRKRGGENARGRIITVFSNKGGAGASFVATNLGVLLARRSERPVVLVDADLQFGDVAVMLGVAPRRTIVDAVKRIERLDPTLLKSLLIKHQPSGLEVLAAPTDPPLADFVTLPHLRAILEVLASFCSHVVIDTPASLDRNVTGLLQLSDDIVLMAGMDVANIKNTKIGLQVLRRLGVPRSSVKLVLNRANSKVRLDIADVERTLQVRADCLIPSDIAVPKSINEGVPIVLEDPKSGVARSLERLAELFSESAAGLGAGRRL